MTDESSDRIPMEPTGESGASDSMERTPQAGEGTDTDEAVTSTGPGQGGSSGRPGEGPTEETQGSPADD